MNAPPPPLPAVRTTCPYCGVGCGVEAKPDGSGGVAISGDPRHPSNYGRLCSKGAALGETLGLERRLLHPLVRLPDGSYGRIEWNAALDRAAAGFARILARDGPEAVAFYLSGQLLTEDYYVANKLMKGFMGSSNVDTNSRLCMASSVAGHRRAFGADTVPGCYEDIDHADLLLLVGSNAAWCHPVLFQRMLANRRARGAKIVVIDPRRTATAEEADLFLPLRPGMDTVLFCGLLARLVDSPALDRPFVAAHTKGLAEALARAREIAPSLAAVSQDTGLPAADIETFYDWFCRTDRVVSCYSQGVNQSAQGTDKVNAIINCYLATGRIGRLGAGPFSLTGQPNAMGGREVGGLANQLAAHMDFSPENVARVGRFWNASRMATRAGLKAVDMFDAIARGKIKALWVMATNPAVSLPQADVVRQALKTLELFVVSENVRSNDTVEAGAHLLLPAAAWGEKDGTVTNSERRISRQRAFLPLPGEAKPDWWIVTQVARRMGHGAAFPYENAAAIFREHAALSAFENRGTRAFDLSGLAGISDAGFDALAPAQWPVERPERPGTKRLFAGGRFYTPDGKASFVAPATPALHAPATDNFPLRLNTGRVRDQWHTMTRSGLSPRLGGHLPYPFVEVHPHDAECAGVADGGFASVTTAHGRCVFKVRVSTGQQRGMLFAPIHWSDATAACARAGDLVAPATDPHSGQPEAKATPAALAPVMFRSTGFVLSRVTPAFAPEDWFARVAVSGGEGALFATDAEPDVWAARARTWFGADMELAEYADAPRGHYRFAAFDEGQLVGCVFIGPFDEAPVWDAVKALFEAGTLATADRRLLLSGCATDGLADAGPLVCACFAVGVAAISRALTEGHAVTVEEIGRALKAGTNCGSCVPELRKLIAAQAAPRTADRILPS
ncbi:MAG: molybdopterin-dependent oxidoreductase [Variibacter sp.]|nr:molybdopterin-dependent oxidoreductase [Variibacter sp.]